MKREFLVIFSKKRIKFHFLTDLFDDDRCYVLDDIRRFDNGFFEKLERFHLSRKLPFKLIWNIDGIIKKNVRFEKDTEYIVLCFDSVPYMARRLKKLASGYKTKFVMLLFNSFSDSCFPPSKKSIDKFGFDYVFTFDPGDAKKYGYLFFDTYYSVFSVPDATEIANDIYYVGRCKDRLRTIHDIFSGAKANGVSARFRVTDVPREDCVHTEILYNQRIRYDAVVKEVTESNCILDILTKGQTGASLRYYEAVCYNRKLLTDNVNIVDLPFYNPEYMRVFEKPEDIDWDWVRERIPVDYHYDGRFSPSRLIDRITEMEEERERVAEKENIF